MDSWGVEECRRNLDQILEWLQQAAADRGLPFSRLGAIALIRLAIWRAAASR